MSLEPVYLIWYSNGLWAGRLRFDSRQCKIFLFFAASRPALGPPSQWVLGALSPGVKWQGHGADYLSPSNTEFKSVGAIPPLPHMSLWHSAYLFKHSNNFTLLYISYYFILPANAVCVHCSRLDHEYFAHSAMFILCFRYSRCALHIWISNTECFPFLWANVLGLFMPLQGEQLTELSASARLEADETDIHLCLISMNRDNIS
jgi:hypothetical protein